MSLVEKKVTQKIKIKDGQCFQTELALYLIGKDGGVSPKSITNSDIPEGWGSKLISIMRVFDAYRKMRKLLNLRAEKLLQRVSEVLWYVHEVVRICTPKHGQCFQSILSQRK